jgi:hypothetical protein
VTCRKCCHQSNPENSCSQKLLRMSQKALCKDEFRVRAGGSSGCFHAAGRLRIGGIHPKVFSIYIFLVSFAPSRI